MAALTLRKARAILKAALAHGAEAGMNPLSVIVVDAGGAPILFERADATSPGRFEIAYGKAHGAVMFGAGGTKLAQMAEARPAFMASLIAAYGGRMVPVQGGVLVRDARGAVLGAVGVTGDTSENDAAAAVAGIEAAGYAAEA